MTGEEQSTWARKLLLGSRLADGGLALEVGSGGSDGPVDQPYRMKGIHFAALSAPGPTGARPPVPGTADQRAATGRSLPVCHRAAWTLLHHQGPLCVSSNMGLTGPFAIREKLCSGNMGKIK